MPLWLLGAMGDLMGHKVPESSLKPALSFFLALSYASIGGAKPKTMAIAIAIIAATVIEEEITGTTTKILTHHFSRKGQKVFYFLINPQ